MTDERNTFKDKHPILNTILAFAILVLMILGSIHTIKLLYAGFVKGILFLASIASKLEAVVLVALITGLVSIIGVIISSIVAKILDYNKSRKEYLAQKREQPYGEFVEMVYKVHANAKKPNSYTDKEMTADILKFSKQITLWGSPSVVNKWTQFRENGTDPGKALDNVFLMEDIMNAMRKDLGMKKVKKEIC